MRRRERLVWGLVGALSWLVLVQGYELLLGVRFGLPTKALVAAAVGAATVALAPRVERRVAPNESA